MAWFRRKNAGEDVSPIETNNHGRADEVSSNRLSRDETIRAAQRELTANKSTAEFVQAAEEIADKTGNSVFQRFLKMLAHEAEAGASRDDIDRLVQDMDLDTAKNNFMSDKDDDYDYSSPPTFED